MPVLKDPILKDLQVSAVEIYTPSASVISSPSSTKQLSYAFFQTSVDCNITIAPIGNSGGGTVVVAVKGGIPYPYAVNKITAVDSSAVVYILHNNH